MGGKLFLVLSLISLCNADGGFWNNFRGSEKDDKDDDRILCDNECDDIDIWSYNNEKYFFEPCDYIDETDCVRKFFGTYSDCRVIKYAEKSPVYRKRHTKVIPKINTTIITTRDQLTNLDGKITKFYINKKSNNLIMAVQFDDIIKQTKKLYFVVDRVGKEPAVAADYANSTHRYTATAIIPLHDGKIQIDKARVWSYVPDGYPTFYLGPKITNSGNPDITKSLVALLADLPTAFQEYFLLEGPGFFLAYLQKYICDFGLPLSN